jgi:acyl-CoA thioesterase FadM
MNWRGLSNKCINLTRNMRVRYLRGALAAQVMQIVRHSAEVINKRMSIGVEVIRRHTVPLEQDGLYGVKQLTTVCSMEVKVKGQNARCLKIPRPQEQSLKCLFYTFFICISGLNYLLRFC